MAHLLRNLATRLVLWLCDRFGIVPLDEARVAMTADAVARSQRWEAFYREAGGLADMIAQARKEAFEAYSECRPDDLAEKDYLAASDRCWRQLEARVRSVIQAGHIEVKRAEQIEAMGIQRPRKSVY